LIARAMALLHSTGEMAVGDRSNGVSIIGSEFHGKVLGTTQVGSLHAIRPQTSGRA
jgi:proline racemase